MTFEEKFYCSAVNMLEENEGFAFHNKNLYNPQELIPQQYFISRELFFYHLKKECPEVINYLYYEIFPYFKKIYHSYISHYKKNKPDKLYIYNWSNFLYYTSQNANNNLIKLTRKIKDWGDKFNLDKNWIYDAALANMSSWIQSEEHENNKTWIYSIPIFLNNENEFKFKKIEDKFIRELTNLAIDSNLLFLSQRNKTLNIPAPKPEIENLTQYRKRIKDIITEGYKEEKNMLKNKGYIKSKNKRDFRVEDHFKWLILSHVKGLKNREIIELLNEKNIGEDNISHVVNDLKKILDL